MIPGLALPVERLPPPSAQAANKSTTATGTARRKTGNYINQLAKCCPTRLAQVQS